MSKTNKIVTIGIQIADLPSIKFNSLESLSPYDTIIFRPKCEEYELYQNAILSYINHWHQELIKAYQKNKNIVFFIPLGTYYTPKDSGNIDLLNSIPFVIDKRATKGKDIKVTNSPLKSIFIDFYETFQNVLQYEYTLTQSYANSAILANHDNDTLAVYFNNQQDGHTVILQDFNDKFLKKPGKNEFESEASYSKKLENFTKNYGDIAQKLKIFIINLVKELSKVNSEFEQIPDWIDGIDLYDTTEEIDCKTKINENIVKITNLNEENKELELKKKQASVLKSLLYASGKQLEFSVNLALNILGANACEYNNEKEALQIDNLIHYNNTLLIGEDKGLDGFAGNSNIGQLTTNTNQYYDLECSVENDVPQKILFINSERKKELTNRKREECCSDKVWKLLKSNSVLVVWTPDLFFVAKYVKDTNDQEFAKKCMDRLLDKKYGLVKFPEIPQK